MTGSQGIHPGLGREKYRLEPGNYPVTRMVSALEEMVVDAKSCSVRVNFMNGSSTALKALREMNDIVDLREVKSVFIHVVYQDGSTISGRPVNSPFRGYLIFDKSPEDIKKKKSAARPQGARIDQLENFPDAPVATHSNRRGSGFKERWEKVESNGLPPIARGIKNVTAAGALCLLVLVTSGVVMAAVTASVGLFPDQQGQSSSPPHPMTNGERVFLISLLFFMLSLVFHTNRLEKFLATRVFRPLVGPFLSRLVEGTKRTFGNIHVHLPLLIITVTGGLIVLLFAKLLGIN